MLNNMEPARTLSGTIVQTFDYNKLPKQDAEYLRGQAAEINARMAITHTLRVEIGKILIDAKARLPGVFLSWVKSEFGYSSDTAENLMNVALRMAELPQGTDALFQARSLYLLGRESTPESVRQEAIDLASTGMPVDYEVAYILAQAPVEIKSRYLLEELPKKTAFDLAKALNRKGLSDEVKSVCLNQRVSCPELIDYLAKAHSDYQRTKGTYKERSTWADIEEDNWVLNGISWSVPLSDARPVDIDRFKVDRSAMHKDFAPQRWEWVVTDAPLQSTSDGRLILILDKPEFETMNEGDYVRLQIRVPKESDNA